MFTRSKITREQLDIYLDFLAVLMVGNPKYECLLPIYKRLEEEIALLNDRDQRLSSINARALKSVASTKRNVVPFVVNQ